jgi:DNA-binding beta-propeller fold protein YncE
MFKSRSAEYELALAKMKAFGIGGYGMMRRTLLVGGIVVLAIALAGCHTTTGTTTAATVSLNIISASIAVGSSQQFLATVTGPTDTTVTWQVNSVTGGDSIHGTISTSGLYTAPTTPPSPNTVTVTAISNAVKTATASATVTIDSGIRVSVTPNAVTIGTGETLQFTDTVSGVAAPNNTVTWRVCQVNSSTSGSCPADTTGSLGTIDASGNYQAPGTVPSSNPVTIQAVSTKDTNQAGSATITLTNATDPTAISIYPTHIARGAPSVDVYLTGTGFLSTTSMVVNGTVLSPGTSLNGGIVLRARLTAPMLSSSLTVLQIQVQRQKGTPVSCTPNPASCQLSIDPERPAIVAASPNSALQGAPNPVEFLVNGGYFGTGSGTGGPTFPPPTPAVTAQFDGNLASSAVSPRQASVTISPADLSVPGLHQVTLTDPLVATPAILPQKFAATNFAVQSCLGAAQNCPEPTISVASLPVGAKPVSIAVNTATGIAVVVNHDANNVMLVQMNGLQPDGVTFIPPALVPGGTIAVGSGPSGVAIDSVRNLAVVTNNTDKTISVVNLATKTMTVVSTQIPAAPVAVGVNPITGLALIAFQATNIGAIVDLKLNPPAFVGAVTLGTGANPQVAVVPTLNWGLVTPGGAGTFSIVDLARRNSNTIASSGAVRVSASNTVTITTTAPHGLITGDAVLVTGVTDSTFNGVFAVATVPTSNSFTYTQAGASSMSGGGTIFYSQPLATVAVGTNVSGISVNSEAKRIVLTDPTDTHVITMSVLDQLVSLITTETGAVSAAVNPYTDIAVTINPVSGQLSVLDPRTPVRLTTLNLPGTNPGAVAIDPGSNQVLVANQGSNDLTAVRLAPPGATQMNPLQLEEVLLPLNRQFGPDLTLSSPTDLPLTLVGKGFNGSSVARVDGFILAPVGPVTDRQMNVVVPGVLLANPRRFAVDVQNTVGNGGVSNVQYFSVVKALDLTSPACPSPQPEAVAIDDLRNLAFVTETGCAKTAVVDLNAQVITNTLAVGNNPEGVATIPRLGLAVVTNRGDNTASVINTVNLALAPVTVAVGGEPIGVAVSPIDGTTFVTNSNSNSNSLTTFTAGTPGNGSSITPVGVSPVAVALDPFDQVALVLNAGGNNVNLLDISVNPPVITGSVSVFSQPTGVAFDPVNNIFIVTASLNNSLFFINPNTHQVSSARIGINPSAIAFNYISNTIVTVNNASGTISVMDATDRRVRSNLALKGAFLGSVAIIPNTNLCLIVDQVNNRLLFVPLPN